MTGGSARRCVRCTLEPGYNRVVLDLVRDVEIGSLCRNCEFEVFDVVFPTLSSDDACTCAVCDRDGFYALPRWLPETKPLGDAAVTRVDYELDDHPLHLCDEHYEELVDTPPATAEISSTSDKL